KTTWTTRTTGSAASALDAILARFGMEFPPAGESPAAMKEKAPAVRTRPARPPVVPPAGSPVITVDGRARPCAPAECHMWTWQGADRWYYAAEHLPPGARRAP